MSQSRSRLYRTRLVVASTAVAMPAALLVALAPAAHATTAPFEPGTVFIADTFNQRVVAVPASGGAQTTVGIGLREPTEVALDTAGADVFIADYFNDRVVEVHPDGSQATVGTGVRAPYGVAVDAAGDVFIADTYNNRVVEVPAGGGSQTTISTGLYRPTGLAVDAAGDVFISDAGNNRVVEVHPDGSQTTVGTGLYDPYGVAVDAAGDVFIADSSNNRVVEVHPDGSQTTVGAGLSYPKGVAVDAAGDVFIADSSNNRVVEVPAGGGSQTTVSTGLNAPGGVAVYAPPPVFTADTPPVTATVGTAYSYTYTASAPTGEPAATFAVASGSLPPGLTLNTATGVLSGTPTTAGTYTFAVQTQNAAQATIGSSTTITVAPGDTTPPTSMVRAGHGTIPWYLPAVTVNGQARLQKTSGVTAGTLKHVQCWDSHGVKLTLNATDAGSGVASLSYSATGAQPIATTTVTSLPVTVGVTANGLSTVDYHATDNAGNVEPAQEQSVLVAGDLSCTAPTPTFTIPRHGVVTLTGTATIGRFRFPYDVTMRY